MAGRYPASGLAVTDSVGMPPTNPCRMVATSSMLALVCILSNHERHSAIVRPLLDMGLHVTSFVFAGIRTRRVALLSGGGCAPPSMGRFAVKKPTIMLLDERSNRIVLLVARKSRGLISPFRLEIPKGVVIADKGYVVDQDAIETLRHNNETQDKFLSV